MSLNLSMPTEGLSGFFANIRGSRRRPAPPPPATAPRPIPAPARAIEEAAEPSRVRVNAISREIALPVQAKRRSLVKAEALARSFIDALETGEHAYRLLKEEFDGLCEEAEIETVSDKRFGTWLKERIPVRYRTGHPSVTMYRVSPRMRSRARAA